jgi:hypothetical protein
MSQNTLELREKMKIFASLKEHPGHLEVIMKTTRLLLPFVHGIDVSAIEQALLMAKGIEATLVPLSLIYVPERRRARGARLEHVQQSKDFLEAVKHKAARYAVPVERLEVFTSDIVQSINLVADEMACEGILLFKGRKDGILLQVNEIKRLVEMPVCKLYIMHLQTEERESIAQRLRQLFTHLLIGRSRKQQEPPQGQESSEDDVVISVRA